MKNRIDLSEYGPKGERYCPQCHARVSLRATDCFMCGTPLYATKPPFWQRWLQRWARLSLVIALILFLGLVVQLNWPRLLARADLTRRNLLAWAATTTPTITPTATPVPFTATPTLTSTITPTPTVEATPTPVIYTVRAGDTMEQIALTYGVSVDAIKKANGLESDFLSIGDRLFIPTTGNHVQKAMLGSKTIIDRPNSASNPQLAAHQDVAPAVTPATAYPAPFPVWPLPGEQITGPTIYFAWTSPANLRSSEAYLLRIWGWPDGAEARFWSTTNTLRLARDALPGASAGRKQFAWQVIIARRPAVISTDGRKTFSPPSKTRRFSLP